MAKPLCGRVVLDVAVMVGGFTATETAFFLGLSVTRVRQLEERASAKVRLALHPEHQGS